MSGDLLLTFNAGSSTVKLGLYRAQSGRPVRVARGIVDFRQDPLTLRVTEGPEPFETTIPSKADALTEILADIAEILGRHVDIGRLAVAGHRIVHGGDRFAGPVRLDEEAIGAIEELVPLAPLHQPQGLRLIRSVRELWPHLVQTASFDTAFHRTNSDTVRRFALPRALHDEGIKRYGFHGLSYKYIAGELARRAPPLARSRIVAAHLGSGASLCGMADGESRDTSMGFSTLDGVPMATRCGALDPGVLLHLLGAGGRSLAEVEDLLYHRSGLLGLSGISADSRRLLESAEPAAKEAIDLFTLRIAGEVARLAATLGGLDALVFTAGIGEHQPAIRAAICDRLAWLGLDLDPQANAGNAQTITRPGSRVAAVVIPTDEEQVIAEEAWTALGHEA
ncbi:acetate/propionate family kinase [Enterovirga rhinocerotis]|uniref:Acetate kinase n=1 Tax=Enterovirga rhinocerotis TaxID=1339210 RepID=A0A4R7BVY7_9HYPH|nr:acetate/propionate family kinase [Enterovirga rhinocerotis]TDR89721.1 acetate kinase [Enterovirga rhinocerotis]